MHLSKNITLNLLCLSLNENAAPLVLAPMSIGCKTKLMEVNKWYFWLSAKRTFSNELNPGNTKGGSIAVPLTSYLTGLD